MNRVVSCLTVLVLHGAERNLVSSGLDPCQLDATAVAVALDDAVPLPQGMTRQWVVDADQLGVWQELSALNADGEVLLQRRQLVSPAAYGLCRS